MPSTASPSTSPLTPQPCTPLASSTAPSPPLHPQVRDGEYILDFQRLSGELFTYIDICAALLSVLRL